MERRPTRLGGQAVIEGVMVRAGDDWSVAVRRPNGTVVTHRGRVPAWMYRFRRVPLVRGALALAASVGLGLKALSWSRSVAEGSAQPAGRAQVVLATVVSVGVFVGVFALVPALVAGLITEGHGLAFALVEGLVRLALLVAYVAAIGRLPGIRRTFEYHGAEHQAIAACEADDVLDVDRVRRYSPRHARCGTDFLVLVAFVAVAVFALVSPGSWWALAASRVVLLPVVAGLAYEILRLSDRPAASKLLRPILAPAMAVQRLTTRTPSDDQIEVAITAVRGAIGG